MNDKRESPCAGKTAKYERKQAMKNEYFLISKEDLKEFEKYLYERENAQATIEKYMTDMHTFFRYLDGCTQIDKACLLSYKEWLLSRYAVNSVNSMLAALNQFLDFRGEGSMKLRRVKTQRPLFLREEKELTRKEYFRLIETAQQSGKIQLALCMETIASTGIRISELPYFTVENIRKGRIEIFNKGKYRRILLGADIRRRLLKYCKKRKIEKGPVFITKNGKPKNRSNLWREMKALKKQAGVSGEKIFPHNLRHLFARVYYQATKDIAGLADLLGHSSLNITRIYTSGTGKIYQKQLDKLKVLQI